MRTCDLCSRPLSDKAYDGRTIHGPWAWMCPTCFTANGTGLGLGYGQAYQFVKGQGYVQTVGGSQPGRVFHEARKESGHASR